MTSKSCRPFKKNKIIIRRENALFYIQKVGIMSTHAAQHILYTCTQSTRGRLILDFLLTIKYKKKTLVDNKMRPEPLVRTRQLRDSFNQYYHENG